MKSSHGINRFDIFLLWLYLSLLIVFLLFLLNEIEVDGINNDDDDDTAAVVVVVLLLFLFCIKICMYTKTLIVDPLSIVYHPLLPNSVSILNFVLTRVSTIPDAMAIDATIIINLWTLGNKVEYQLSLLAGNIITNIKNIIPHHIIEEKKWMYLITRVPSHSKIIVNIINGKTDPL